MNAAERFFAASRSRNVDAAVAALAPDIVMLNPATDDPIAGHKALEAAGFPPSQRDNFITRWRARPVIRVRSADRSLITTRGATEDAKMWILLADTGSRRCPVVLAPAAYDARSRELGDAIAGIFSLTAPGSGKTVMDRPALVSPLDNDPDTFAVARAGIVRA